MTNTSTNNLSHNSTGSSRRRRRCCSSTQQKTFSMMMGAGLLAFLGCGNNNQASAFSFNVPTASLVESDTVSGRAIAARRTHRSTSSHAIPVPRMAATSSAAAASDSRRIQQRIPTPIIDQIPTPIIARSPPQQGGGGALARPPGGATASTGGSGGREQRPDGKSPDFEVNLGRLISTLQMDYPKIFSDPPSFDIFTEDIELLDPTGVAFKGIGNYKRVFATLRFFRQVLMKDAKTTFRLTYDWSKQQVRVSWNMVLVLKAGRRPIYVDGISAYHVNSDGNAYRHELETVVVNGTPVEPPFAYAWINLPAWVAGNRQPSAMPAPLPNGIVSSNKLFAAASPDIEQLLARDTKHDVDVDVEMQSLLSAYQTDPQVRDDFLKALTVLAAAVDDSAATSEQVAMAIAGGESSSENAVEGKAGEENEATPAPAPRKVRPLKEKKEGGWFGIQGPTECETSWDCSGGMVCCDYLLVKVCCSNGIRQPKFGDLIPSLVPIPGRGRNENDRPTPKRPLPRNGERSGGKITW